MAHVKAIKSSVVLLNVMIPQGETREFDDKVLDCDDVRHVVKLGSIEITRKKSLPELPKQEEKKKEMAPPETCDGEKGEGKKEVPRKLEKTPKHEE